MIYIVMWVTDFTYWYKIYFIKIYIYKLLIFTHINKGGGKIVV